MSRLTVGSITSWWHNDVSRIPFVAGSLLLCYLNKTFSNTVHNVHMFNHYVCCFCVVLLVSLCVIIVCKFGQMRSVILRDRAVAQYWSLLSPNTSLALEHTFWFTLHAMCPPNTSLSPRNLNCHSECKGSNFVFCYLQFSNVFVLFLFTLSWYTLFITQYKHRAWKWHLAVLVD